MTSRQPIAGYATKTDAVIDMIDNRKMNPAAVARALDTSAECVRNLYFRRTNKRPSGYSKINISMDVINDAEPHAQARGITAHELCRRILAAALEDKLVDAILDDAKAETRQ